MKFSKSIRIGLLKSISCSLVHYQFTIPHTHQEGSNQQNKRYIDSLTTCKIKINTNNNLFLKRRNTKNNHKSIIQLSRRIKTEEQEHFELPVVRRSAKQWRLKPNSLWVVGRERHRNCVLHHVPDVENVSICEACN
jgi:hypothetical protein